MSLLLGETSGDDGKIKEDDEIAIDKNYLKDPSLFRRFLMVIMNKTNPVIAFAPGFYIILNHFIIISERITKFPITIWNSINIE